jgi:predicted ATPase
LRPGGIFYRRPQRAAIWHTVRMALSAKPYLRDIEIDPRADVDWSAYPFNIPAVRAMGRLAYPGAKIVQFDGAGIAEVAFKDCEPLLVTRDFLNHYPRRLQQLLADD